MELLVLLLVLGGALALGGGGGDDGDGSEDGAPDGATTSTSSDVVDLTIAATAGDAFIQGKGGDDQIDLLSDHVLVDALQGDDTITVTGTVTDIFAGEGDDVVDASASAGDFTAIAGGDGADTITGTNQDDVIHADGPNSARASQVNGDHPFDVAFEGNMSSDDGDADVINGLGGDDVLIFGAGDQASGGEGNDTYVIADLEAVYEANTPAQILDWAPGETITVLGAAASADLVVEVVDDDAVVLWQDRAILEVLGGAGDAIMIDAAILYMQAIDPSVFVDPADQVDFIEGTPEDDTINAVSNNLEIYSYDGNDTINAQSDGYATIYAGDGDDVVTFSGDVISNEINGGEGADRLTGGIGPDQLYSHNGHAYQETQQANASGQPLLNDSAADVLDGGAGNDDLHISAGDTATGGVDGDVFHVDGDGILADANPAIITDWEAIDDVLLNYSGSLLPTVANENGNAVVYLGTQPVIIALGVGGTLTVDDISPS